MGLFGGIKNQLANVVEWKEWRDDMIFWKWSNCELKKGSKLILRPGQDALIIHNGRIGAVPQDDGEYNIESDIIPFLSMLKGIKFGFNSGMRVEVLFVNTKEFLIKWGTKSPVNIPTPQMPGGMPIRANGTANFKVTDYLTLVENIAGIKEEYYVDDVKTRITTVLNELLMKHITTEGQDMFHLQAYASEIGEGIRKDLTARTEKDGITITGFSVNSFNYPEEIQAMITKNAAQAMVGDVGRYQQLSMTDAMASGKLSGNSTMSNMTEMMMGMQMANQMMGQMNMGGAGMPQQQQGGYAQQPQQQSAPAGGGAADAGAGPKFCPECGTKTTGAKFCPNCGYKLIG